MEAILIPHGELNRLAEQFGVSSHTASKYLRGLYDTRNAEVSRKADEFRQLAINSGGVTQNN